MITGLKVGFEQRFEECLTLGGRIVAVLQLGENHFLEGDVSANACSARR
jgi:hypothetical protein